MWSLKIKVESGPYTNNVNKDYIPEDWEAGGGGGDGVDGGEYCDGDTGGDPKQLIIIIFLFVSFITFIKF